MSQFIEIFGTIDEPKVEVKKLIDVVLSSGQYGSNTSATDYQEGKPRYIRITDINDDGSLNDDIKTAEVIEDKYRLIPGDIVFAKTGATVGKTYMHETGNAIYAGYLIKYQMNESKMKPAFMKAFTHSKTYYNWVANSQKVGAQPNISAAQYDNMPVLVPQIEKQEEFLTIYHQADKSGFDGRKSQFIEMTGDPRTNPKGWPVKTLSELATYSIGLTYKPENISEDGTIVLRSGNIQNSKIDLGDIVRVNCPIKESIYVQKNDILMCSRNGSAALVGKVAMIKDIPEPMTYGAFMTVIRSEYSDYLYLYFQSNDFREQVSTGKSSTMNQITQNMLDKISLPLPDDETRKKLSIILHQADKSGFELRKSIDAIDSVIKSLINC